MNELLELFTELALVIEKNGEAIDRVGLQFDDAQHYVEGTEKTLINTNRIAKQNSKLSCAIIIVILVIVTMGVCWLFNLF